MKNRFKTLRVCINHHLVLCFTLAMSFGNTLLTAQCSSTGQIYLKLTIGQNGNGENFVSGYLSSPNQSYNAYNSYNAYVSIEDAPTTVRSVTLNFGNGQTETINLGGGSSFQSDYSVYYSDRSSHNISATVEYNSAPPVTWVETFNRFGNRVIDSWAYKAPDEVIYMSGINVHIKYAPNNQTRSLKKPIIFVEGIDFSKELTCDHTGNTVRVGSFGWDTFITGMVEDPNDPDNETFAMLPEFANQILSDGYDLVFCDFKDGVDYIENNGRALIEVINEVNRRKQTNLGPKQNCYMNTVVGASMGGQVARWALRTMENEGQQHDTNLYFSLDSPHKGANIPLALQAFVWHGANHGPEGADKEDMKKVWAGLASPAAKQLLAFHLENNGEHSNYMSMMSQLGYPQRTRNIASSNGSGYSTNQGYSNNSSLGFINGSINVLSTTGVNVFEASLNATNNSTIAHVFRVYSTPKSIWDLPTLVQAGHMQLLKQSNNSVVLKTADVTRSLGNINGFTWPTTRTISFDKDFTQWDNAPGGNRNDLAYSFFPTLQKALREYRPIYQPPFGRQCFIPTVSALDLATNDLYTHVSNFIGQPNNPYPNKTPFKSIYFPNENQPHVFMSHGLLAFSRNEIMAHTKVSCRALTEETLSREASSGGN